MEHKITLKAARVNAGFTQSEAAEKLGKAKQTIAAWENGARSPKANDLITLCGVYGVTMNDIIMP